MPSDTPAQPAGAVGAGAQDWQATLMQEFGACADAIDNQIAGTVLSDTALQKLRDQRDAYRLAVEKLQLNQLATVLGQAPGLTQSLQDAAVKAKQAVAQIQAISNAVGLAASLLVLATAIATAVTTGSPTGLIPAAQGVVTAANKILQPQQQ